VPAGYGGGTARRGDLDASRASAPAAMPVVPRAGGTARSGRYRSHGNQAPTVTVTATLPLPLLLTGLGLTGTWTLQAKAQSAVVGI